MLLYVKKKNDYMKYLTIVLTICLCMPAFSQVKIHVQIDSSIHKSFTGKLYIFTQNDTSKRVPNNPDPSQAMFAWEINNLENSTTISLDKASSRLLPAGSANLKPGYYKIAGIIDTDFDERGSYNTGNIYARKEALLYVNEEGVGHTTLVFETQIGERKFRETDVQKEIKLQSKLLSAFRKKAIFMQAALRLPASYHTDTNRLYPVVFVIPGWGGTHYDLMSNNPVQRYGMTEGKEKIYVYLNPETQSPFGLHAFVDSRVNGPWGKALVEEMVPYLEKHFRVIPDASQHFVMGQSTGGYGSLWLQLNYPDAFGGCWAVSPDPVDFSSFTGVNLYEPNANMYTDKEGKERGFFIIDGKALYTTRSFISTEIFIGDGEQFQAFEAEFGMPDKKGRPREVFNRTTGKIDAAVVKTWQDYDLGLFISKHAKSLANKLEGKVHVYAGSIDNFFLQEAVNAFGAKAKAANLPLVAELIPGADHWSIWSPAFTTRVQKEIDVRIK